MTTRLDAASLLGLWEAGQPLHPLDRAVLLACAALPGRTWDEVADLPVGARDAAILRLRRAAVHDSLAASAGCPACGATCELSVSIQSLLDQEGGDTAAMPGLEGARLPSSRDLAAALLAGMQAPGLTLAARCLGQGSDAAPDQECLAQLSDWVAARDPLSEIRLSLTCHGCAHEWDETFDPPSFFWREIEARAARLFDEVDRLARVYGWREREVLALSEARRAAYLERVT